MTNVRINWISLLCEKQNCATCIIVKCFFKQRSWDEWVQDCESNQFWALWPWMLFCWKTIEISLTAIVIPTIESVMLRPDLVQRSTTYRSLYTHSIMILHINSLKHKKPFTFNSRFNLILIIFRHPSEQRVRQPRGRSS